MIGLFLTVSISMQINYCITGHKVNFYSIHNYCSYISSYSHINCVKSDRTPEIVKQSLTTLYTSQHVAGYVMAKTPARTCLIHGTQVRVYKYSNT